MSLSRDGCVWLQNIDGIMMARQFDTGKNSECYRPIPVHTPSSRRLSVAKPYMPTNSETTASPRYDQEYDYKTTHYPSYPPNYPYDETNKYKYDQQAAPSAPQQQQQQQQISSQQQQQQQQYGSGGSGGGYDKQVYSTYEDINYESRSGYMQPHPPPSAVTGNYASESEYSRYPGYEGRTGYTGPENSEYDKGRYGYGYDRSYYEADGRYMPDGARHETRYNDARHHDGRSIPDNRDAVECRYPADGRDERRYTDGRDDEGRDGDTRYMDGRSDGRYPTKENYYDRYYKHRPSREHHATESSRY